MGSLLAARPPLISLSDSETSTAAPNILNGDNNNNNDDDGTFSAPQQQQHFTGELNWFQMKIDLARAIDLLGRMENLTGTTREVMELAKTVLGDLENDEKATGSAFKSVLERTKDVTQKLQENLEVMLSEVEWLERENKHTEARGTSLQRNVCLELSLFISSLCFGLGGTNERGAGEEHAADELAKLVMRYPRP